MITHRLAETADLERIADLHMRSWQLAYRGILRDDYLDKAIGPDRLALWGDRFANPAPNQRILVAEEAGNLLGFICLFLDDDSVRGTLIDNLHVDPALKGQGIGSGLMHEATRRFIPEASSSGFYLGVYEANVPAIYFYERMGGTCLGRALYDTPGGGQALILWYGWPTGLQLPTGIR
ncbi:GNAT family N-acetyltransferase [Fibrella sp. HMF5335]|uniref:GNAT family N-acetyltransferase n=1 Tax=Fibrella rubiginis TaxID=2817060 RepID=A0A939K295_9BACT|nr:GNAT family N-acetyltransferase [Fibrella rubiginis]MBO0937987.1 GNAT family N-acetyltransferase [Fibrella rubiginis]